MTDQILACPYGHAVGALVQSLTEKNLILVTFMRASPTIDSATGEFTTKLQSVPIVTVAMTMEQATEIAQMIQTTVEGSKPGETPPKTKAGWN